MSGERWACVVTNRSGERALVTVGGRLLVATDEREREVLAFGEPVLLPPVGAFDAEITVSQWLAKQGYRPSDMTEAVTSA